MAQGQLAPATPVGKGASFRFVAYPIDKLSNFPPLDFRIFEIAGEDYDDVVRSRENPEPRFPPGLGIFLVNKRRMLNFVLVFMCDGESLEDDDEFFESFINLIDSEFSEDDAEYFWQSTPILLIISKPRFARQKVTTADVSRYKNAPLSLINIFLPRTVAKIKQKESVFLPTFLDIGDVEQTEVDGVIVNRLTNPKFDDIRRIFRWIYFQWTGRRIGKVDDFWMRFFRMLGL